MLPREARDDAAAVRGREREHPQAAPQLVHKGRHAALPGVHDEAVSWAQGNGAPNFPINSPVTTMHQPGWLSAVPTGRTPAATSQGWGRRTSNSPAAGGGNQVAIRAKTCLL